MMNKAKALKSLSTLLILTLFVYFMKGCAEPQVVYKEVKVPVACDVKERKKPLKNANVLEYLKEVLVYAEGLEKDLNYCKGKK